jgi:hypothetical protein
VSPKRRALTSQEDSDEQQILSVGRLYGRKFAAVAESHGLHLWNAFELAASYLELFRDVVHFDAPLLKMVEIF